MTPHRLLALGLAVLCAIAGVGAALLRPLHAKNPELQAELVAMQEAVSEARRDRDNAQRGVFVNPTDEQIRVTELNVANVARLKQIIERYGWPGKKLVGSDGAHAAWLIATLSVGHDPATVVEDNAFLAQVLALMKRAGNDVSKSDRAYLDDRVAAMNGQPQTYGTQWGCPDGELVPLTPVRDESGLDARRKAVGLRPLHEQLKDMMFQIGCGRGTRRIIVRP